MIGRRCSHRCTRAQRYADRLHLQSLPLCESCDRRIVAEAKALREIGSVVQLSRGSETNSAEHMKLRPDQTITLSNNQNFAALDRLSVTTRGTGRTCRRGPRNNTENNRAKVTATQLPQLPRVVTPSREMRSRCPRLGGNLLQNYFGTQSGEHFSKSSLD
jgi:hypothetical protein